MCGIFGIYRSHGGIDLDVLSRANGLQRHRGPDDSGYLLWRHPDRLVLCGDADTAPSLGLSRIEARKHEPFALGLAFRRLAIQDLSPRSHQPMGTPDGGAWIVFNGEVYNFIELRQKLEGEGLSFGSDGDTEVLLAAFMHWGPAAFRCCLGVFAAAIVDLRRHRLLLARDGFGIKPLYYFADGETFAFGSHIPSLLEVPGVRHRAHAGRLRDLLLTGFTDHGAEILVEGIHQLPPGNLLEVALEGPPALRMEAFWQPPLEPLLDITPSEAVAEVRRMVLRNVELHMRSDVSVGASLSGGVDSSSIVTAMRHLSGPDWDLHTFSYVADEKTGNDEPWIEVVEAKVRPIVHRFHIEAASLPAGIDRLMVVHGEPFGSPAVFAQYHLFEEARRNGITVVLNGQGADELLAGYPLYLRPRLKTLVRDGRWLRSIRFARGSSPLLRRPPLALLWEAGGLSLPRGTFPTDLAPPAWTTWRPDTTGALPAMALPDGGSLSGHMVHSIRTSLPFLLRCEDRNSMAWSVESRVPFLTHDLAEFTLRLPEELLIDEDGTGKRILRLALADLLPEAVQRRKRKIGFASPSVRWLRGLEPWVDDVLAQTRRDPPPGFVVDELDAEWRAVRNALPDPAACDRFESGLWRALAALRWAQRFDIELPSPPCPVPHAPRLRSRSIVPSPTAL